MADLQAISLPAAPRPQEGEALSCWIARVADAHGASLGDFEKTFGFVAIDLDRDQARGVRRSLAAATALPDRELVALIHPALLGSRPSCLGRLRRSDPGAMWAVCRSCLHVDLDAGRPPYVRARWTHPLSAWCFDHEEGLVAYETQEVEIVSCGVLAPRISRVYSDAVVRPQPSRQFLRTQKALLEGQVSDPWLLALHDIAEALLCQEAFGAGPRSLLISHWLNARNEEAWRDRADLIHWASLWSLSATKRLALLAIAAEFFDEPDDPLGEPASPRLAQYLGRAERTVLVKHDGVFRPERTYRPKATGYRRLVHAIWDPLFDVAARLGPEDARTLQVASLHWPAELRRRMLYAAAFGVAVGSTRQPRCARNGSQSAVHRQGRVDHGPDAAQAP